MRYLANPPVSLLVNLLHVLTSGCSCTGAVPRSAVCVLVFLFSLEVVPQLSAAVGPVVTNTSSMPPSLESYADSHLTSVREILAGRVQKNPFNWVATLLFFGAIIHTGLTHKFRSWAHRIEESHLAKVRASLASGSSIPVRQVSGTARILHFLGEVEAVFGIWVLPLIIAMYSYGGKAATRAYFHERLSFTEPIFVVVVMSIASTRPILRLAEMGLQKLAQWGGGTPKAWWLAILLVGPMLGSFITEPAAMTICAVLLSRKFYIYEPSPGLAYATLGLLFVSISTGGTLTHFAAPPVLMVAGPWGWDTPFMLRHFGWKALLGVVVSVAAYFLLFRKDLDSLSRGHVTVAEPPQVSIPLWVTAGHLVFLTLSVMYAHEPVYLALAFLFFLAFVEVTEEFQEEFSLRAPVLVGFFLAGLVIHGGLQQWWIAPVLGSLSETPLFLGALFLTAFNDNAAITYLCTLVPSFTEPMKNAAVAGAVVGGGLTVIANAPNPAGQSILNRHFRDGISVAGLFLGALLPTAIQAISFMVFRGIPQ